MINVPNFNEINHVVAYLRRVPYDIAPKLMYDGNSLYEGRIDSSAEGFDGCYDSKVYKHFLDTGKLTNCVEESLATATVFQPKADL